MGVVCKAFIATSLDGFIARADGDIDWLDDPRYEIPDEDFGFFRHFNTIDGLLMGRNTYELAISFEEWYYGDKPIYVLSSGQPEIPEHLSKTVSIVSGDLSDILREIEQRGHHSLYIDGGKTIQAFLREGLLDEITITKIPVLLGNGIPLFWELPKDVHLKHMATRTWDNGFVQTHYAIEHES